MGWACSTYGERGGTSRVLVGKSEEGDYLEYPGIDWMIILKWIFEKWDGGLDWIDLG
jgi:hypothetical protein